MTTGGWERHQTILPGSDGQRVPTYFLYLRDGYAAVRYDPERNVWNYWTARTWEQDSRCPQHHMLRTANAGVRVIAEGSARLLRNAQRRAAADFELPFHPHCDYWRRCAKVSADWHVTHRPGPSRTVPIAKQRPNA